MYHKDAEVLFPSRVIPLLRYLRGKQWQRLIERVMEVPEDHPDSLAFSLMMIRLDGCLSCQADSYRSMQGCTLCAQQTITRFKGSDDELIKRWEAARSEVLVWLQAQTARSARPA